MQVRLSQATGRPSYGAAAEHIIRFLDAAYPGQARSCSADAGAMPRSLCTNARVTCKM